MYLEGGIIISLQLRVAIFAFSKACLQTRSRTELHHLSLEGRD